MNGLRWSADDMPECLKDYDGQFALTLWYKAVSKTFRTNCPIGRHFRSFKFHQNCFVASEAVSWLQEQLKDGHFKVDFTRDQTLALLQTMQRLERMFLDVRGNAYDAEKIQDNGTLYRFCDYEAFGDWGLPCQTPNSDQMYAVEIVRGMNCNSLFSRLKNVKPEKTNSVVQEQQRELYHSPKSDPRMLLTSTLAPHASFDEDRLTRELFSSPAFGNINFTLSRSVQGEFCNSRETPRGSVPRLSAHEAALEENWTARDADLPGLHRRNSASRLNSQVLKAGDARAHRNRVHSLVFRSRKEFHEHAGLRERSNKPLSRTDSARMNPGFHHKTIRSELQSRVTNFGQIHAHLSQNNSAETRHLADNGLLKMEPAKKFQSSSLRNELDVHDAPLFEPVGEPDMDFEPLIKSNSYLLQAKSVSELQLLLDFSERLRNLLSVKDLNSVFDTSVINLTNFLDNNRYETEVSASCEELFPKYVLEVLQSLVNWPKGDVSSGSRCLTHAFDFMENYFTCVIDPLFSYKLYPVFAGVTETLRRNERQIKRDADKENQLSQKNQFCVCLQNKAYFQSISREHRPDAGLSYNRNHRYHYAPVSTSNEPSVSRKPACMPCLILSDEQGSKSKVTVQAGITLPRNPALESYLRRNTLTNVNTTDSSSLLGDLSTDSNELYETAVCSFSEYEGDSFEQPSLGSSDGTFQRNTPEGFHFDDCRLSLNGNLQRMNYESSFDHSCYNSFVSDVSEAKLIEVLQLSCLLLNSLERRRIWFFLDVIRKIVWNVNVKVEGVGCKCERMACRLATALFRCKDARQYNPQLAALLTKVFFRHGEFILERRKQCEVASNSQCQFTRGHSVPANPCHQGSSSSSGVVPVAFCSRISKDEYELQSSGGTKAELRKLLDDITSNKVISTKAKNNQLKKFQKAYPDIYHERFPVSAIPRTRQPSFRKPLDLLRNLRI